MGKYACKVDGCPESFDTIGELRPHYKDVHNLDRSPAYRPRAAQRDRDANAAEGGSDPNASPEELELGVERRAPSATEGVELPPGEEEVVRPRGLKAKARELRDRAKGVASPEASAAAKPERKRRAASPRVSTAGGWAGLWQNTGTLLVNSGIDAPVGRALVYQAPRAGELLDHVIEGTVVDRIVQPFARKGKAAGELGSLVMLPVLVGLYERNPSPMLEMMLRKVMRDHLEAMVPIVKKQREEEARFEQIVLDLGLDPGADPIGAVLSEMLAGSRFAAQWAEPAGGAGQTAEEMVG